MRRDRHALAEHRSLLLHREIAARLTADPRLLERARVKVAAWLATGRVHREYALAWSRLLEGPLPALLQAITSDNESSTALRQTTPFAYVVDAATRNRIFHEAHSEWEAARAAS